MAQHILLNASLTRRHDWYQTESFVTLDVFAKRVKPEDLEVDLQDNHVRTVSVNSLPVCLRCMMTGYM